MASIREQIRILRNKGMIISSPKEVRKVLLNENYYNVINAYKDLFLDASYVKINPTDPDESFLPNVNFNELYSMFLFDKELRELFLKYFLIFENQIKTHIAYEFSNIYGEFGYLNYNNFEFNSLNSLNVVELQSIINSTIYKNKNTDRIKHFFNTNIQPIPLWSLVSFFEIGKIRKFYINCKPALRNKIASYYGLRDNELLSFIATINMYRNVCAHDNRLYCYKIYDVNKQITSMPIHSFMHLRTISTATGPRYILGKRDLFACVIALRYLLSDELFYDFFSDLESIIDSLSLKITSINIDNILEKMGFPIATSAGQLNWKEVIIVPKR